MSRKPSMKKQPKPRWQRFLEKSDRALQAEKRHAQRTWKDEEAMPKLWKPSRRLPK